MTDMGDAREGALTISSDREGANILSLASHELRTTLSIIKWYAEMLLDGDCGPLNEEQTKYLKTIESSNQRAIDLIRSLLNVSRLDLGTFGIVPADVDIESILKDVLHNQEPLRKGKDVQIKEEYEKNEGGLPLRLPLDKQICVVIFRSIIRNAILFSNKEGIVTIKVFSCKKDEGYGAMNIPEDGVVISVSDVGIGILEQEKGKVFSKLFRGSNARDVDGSGLSLYVVSEIVKKTGGSVWFDSGKDRGTTFYVYFPNKGMSPKQGRVSLD